MHLVIRFLVNAIALYLIARYVSGFNHHMGFGTALIAALVFGLVNALLGPILRLVSLPLTIVTFGLFSIVVNFMLFSLTTWIAPSFRDPAVSNTWLANFIGAVIMMVVSALVREAWIPEQERQRR
jgi:putative membrane protein